MSFRCHRCWCYDLRYLPRLPARCCAILQPHLVEGYGGPDSTYRLAYTRHRRRYLVLYTADQGKSRNHVGPTVTAIAEFDTAEGGKVHTHSKVSLFGLIGCSSNVADTSVTLSFKIKFVQVPLWPLNSAIASVPLATSPIASSILSSRPFLVLLVCDFRVIFSGLLLTMRRR